MKKIYFFLVSILLCSGAAQAQQEHHYTQFMYNKMLINPGYAGARGVPFVTGLYRNQWAGFDGAPKSALVSFNTPFLVPRVGAGLTLSHRQIGIQRDIYGALAYSYDLLEKENVSLRAGLMASIRSLSMDFTDALPLLPNDQSIDNQKVNDVLVNVGAGIYGTVADQYYFGISVPSGYGNTLGLKNSNAQTSAREFQHFYIMGGANFPLSEDISLLPAVLLKYVKHAPFDADLNVNLDVKRKMTFGLSYRLGGDGPGDSIDFLVFVKASSMIGIGASYDFTLSEIKDHTSGSFEALVQVDLKRKKNNMSNPRFFF